MRSLIYGADDTTMSTTVANYNFIAGTNLISWNSSESNRQIYCPCDFTLSYLLINLESAPGAVDIVTFYYDGTNYYGQAALNFS